MKMFPPHATDFYKTGHIKQYPTGTDYVYCNFTARDAKYAVALPDFDNKVVFFGLQAVCQWLLIDMWNTEFFMQEKEKVVAKYKRRMDSSLGPDAVPTAHIEALHDLGYLPVMIKALPEGSRVNIKVPMFTVQNTNENFAWVVGYIETQLSAELWGMINSATIANEFRRLLSSWAELTGSPQEFVSWQGHDFSARGMRGIHAAASSGAGHLLSFTGTDTIAAIDFLEDYYHASDTFVGGSVPATEHSVMCMGGSDDEVATFRRLITEIYPTGIVSVVSDTWDFWQVLTVYAKELHEEIMNRKPDALGFNKVVFRPDSGDPVKIICGDPEAPEGSPAFKGAIECLWEEFGGTYTNNHFKVLDQHVGLIYGDSINLERAFQILRGMWINGFASCNIVFGIGSHTYNYNTRDTFGHAYKATFGAVNGEGRELFKEPKTDDGMKKSAKGLLRVEKRDGNFILHDRQTQFQESKGELKVMFCNGVLSSHQTLDEIRNRLKNS